MEAEWKFPKLLIGSYKLILLLKLKSKYVDIEVIAKGEREKKQISKIKIIKLSLPIKKKSLFLPRVLVVYSI